MTNLAPINTAIEVSNADDFRVYSYMDGTLVIAGSKNISYYHEIEIVFTDVVYMTVSTDYFDTLILSMAQKSESKKIKTLVGFDSEYSVICMQTSDSDLPYCHIVAKSCEAKQAMVYYYHRPDLKDGENIAPWVEKEK